MSEIINASFLLGLIGTVTGGFALGLAYATYRFQKPSLEIKVVRLNHGYHKAGIEGWFPVGATVIRFVGAVEIKNKGDRGTTINQINLSFKNDGKDCILEIPTYGKQTKITDGWGNEITNVEYRWINPSELIAIPLVIEEEFNGAQEKEIKCLIEVRSTRKNKFEKYISRVDSR